MGKVLEVPESSEMRYERALRLIRELRESKSVVLAASEEQLVQDIEAGRAVTAGRISLLEDVHRRHIEGTE